MLETNGKKKGGKDSTLGSRRKAKTKDKQQDSFL